MRKAVGGGCPKSSSTLKLKRMNELFGVVMG
jgi:hypothetical protein